MSELTLPLPRQPKSFYEVVFFAVGLTFGRAFGKKIDYRFQKTNWFSRRHALWKEAIGRLLDATHHWWMGAILMMLTELSVQMVAYQIVPWPGFKPLSGEWYWFGYGVLVDDLPDVLPRLKEIWTDMKAAWSS